ncbi:MAG: hypothetical protein WCF33_11570 [Pseudonocardiaceae bacterium]
MSNGPEDSGGRWWEIQGEVQLDEGGPRELMTDSRGRSRPERSLSAGTDLTDESGHAARAFLWPIVSAVAAVGLIVSVVYVMKDKSATPASAAPPGAAARSSVQDDPEVKQDPGIKSPVVPQVPQGGPPTAGGVAQPPVGAWSGTPRGPVGNSGGIVAPPPANAPGTSAAAPGSPASPPSGGSGAVTGQTGNQPSGPPTSSTAAPYSAPTLHGPAPDAPRSHKVGPREPGTDGCKVSNDKYYSCNIPRDAPYYFAATTEPRGPIHGDYLFLCQVAGSKYSVGDRANHWWAWLWVPYIHYVIWVPVVFLTGGSNNAPEQGLPVCDPSTTASAGSETTSTTAPPTMSASSAPTTTSGARPS